MGAHLEIDYGLVRNCVTDGTRFHASGSAKTDGELDTQSSNGRTGQHPRDM